MRLPDGTILRHEQVPYDPVKAHEYYLRTRNLKGRTKSSAYTVSLAGGKKVQLSRQQLVEQQAYAAKRVDEIKARLVELGTQLRKLMTEAKAKKAKSKRKADKSPTAAEKTKAARESKQYRQKHQQTLASKAKRTKKSKPTKSKADPVAELETKIKQVKSNLSAAVATQRALTTATRNS